MSSELAAGIRWLDLSGVNAFLVDDESALTLVDTGTPLDASRIQRGVAEAGYAVADVDRVLVTHYDLDHVGGLGRLGLDADVYAGSADAAVLRGEEKPSWRSRKGALQRVVGPFVRRQADVEALEDGARVGSFTAYHTPGHTPGHTAFVSEARSAAFLGDLVRESDGRLEPSPWFISADADAVRESILRLAEAAPPFEVAGMGHGVPFREDGSERLSGLADRL